MKEQVKKPVVRDGLTGRILKECTCGKYKPISATRSRCYWCGNMKPLNLKP